MLTWESARPDGTPRPHVPAIVVAQTRPRAVAAPPLHTMLFGAGRAMAELRAIVSTIADTDVPVLIYGESGTGKELVARALASSARWRAAPFVKVNCAALPGELFEAELFGVEQGAFTGADRSRPGKFEAAHGGTIFLDEIGEIPLSHQAKLLQVLQDGHYSRVGGRDERHSSARVIAATNRDLQREVIAGAFREDLLFRLNVIPLRLPALRHRKHDIVQLVEFFMDRWTVRHKRPRPVLSVAFLEGCLRYHWPGNIRELENVVQRIVLEGNDQSSVRRLAGQSPTDTGTSLVPAAIHLMAPAPRPIQIRSLKTVSRRAVETAERACIASMLVQTRGNRRRAALNLGVCYKSLRLKAKAFGL